jgi:hypothetical protein
VLLIPSTAVDAQRLKEDVQDLLDRFDSRLGEVRDLVEASRDPEADRLLGQAIAVRDQAENELRGGDLNRARELAIRALDLLDKAARRARSGGAGGASLQKLKRLLDSNRQVLEDSRRRLRDEEIRAENPNNLPGDVSFILRQAETTTRLVEQAEEEAQDTLTARDNELSLRARTLLNQANSLIPQDGNPLPIQGSYAENRIREARTLLDQAEEDLDSIEQELDNPAGKGAASAALTSSLDTRLRNTGRQINRANDVLDLAENQGRGPGNAPGNTVLGLLRRASDLARQALRAGEGGAHLQEDFNNRNETVGSLIQQVEELLSGSATPPPEFTQAVGLRDQAVQSANQGDYEQALRLLADAAGHLNRVLAQLGANTSPESRLEVLHRLREQFEQRFDEISSHLVAGSVCSTQIQAARGQSDRSLSLEQTGNLEGALQALNQAQRALEEAAVCLGLNTSRIQSLLDRLQAEFDRRSSEIEGNLPDDVNPAATVLLAEANNLRQLSDNQEGQGQIELAVQSVGRALSTLGAAQRLIFSPEGSNDIELLDRLQSQFDARFPQVEDVVSDAVNPQAATLLSEAERLRQESETSQSAGRIRMALNQMGLAIQSLEQATLVALGRTGSASGL